MAPREKEIGPLTKRIKGMERNKLLEKIKDIFKKHGVTLTAIIFAAGVTISSVIEVIKNALTKTGKALGKGLEKTGKDLGNTERNGEKNSFYSARASRLDNFFPFQNRGTGHRVSG